MYQNCLIHSSADGHVGCFHVLAIITVLQRTLGYTCLFQFWFPQCVCPGVGFSLSHGNFIFRFLRNRHAALHSDCTSLHSHQQCKSVPYSPHPLQHFLLVDIWLADILPGVKWYLTVVLTCNLSDNESDFILGGFKITADSDDSHEIKRHLLLGRKVMTNLDSILKSIDITLPENVHLVKAMVFPLVVYGSESWTVKKADCWRMDAFELWCWRRLLRVPWIARRSNQSILKEISPGCSLEGLMLKLKLQYFGHLVWRVDSLEKSLMLGGIGGRRRRGRQMAGWHHRLDVHESE